MERLRWMIARWKRRWANREYESPTISSYQWSLLLTDQQYRERRSYIYANHR